MQSFSKFIKSWKLIRGIVPVMVILALVGVFIYATPDTAKALDVSVSASSVQQGNQLSFSIGVNIQSIDEVPLSSVQLIFSDSPGGSGSYQNAFSGLPLTSGGTTLNSGSSTVSVSASTNAAWDQLISSSYGYGEYAGDAMITYSGSWSSPSAWPAGQYYITVIAVGGEQGITSSKSQAFQITAAEDITENQSVPVETEPGTWDTKTVVDNQGVFVTKTTVQSTPSDTGEELSITIPEGIKGETTNGETVSTIKVTQTDSTTVPPAPESIAGKKNVLLFSYNVDVNDGQHVEFDKPVTLAFSVIEDQLPADVALTDLVVAWYDEVTKEWVELPTTYDPVTHELKVEVNHFSTWAVFARVNTEEATGGLAWWVWLIIGIAVVVIVALGYLYWWKPRRV